MITSSLGSGDTPHYTLDIFAVFVGSQFVSCFSPYYGGKVLYLMPLYIAWKLGSWLISYMSNKSNDAMTAENKEVDPVEAKRLAKKERKEAR